MLTTRVASFFLTHSVKSQYNAEIDCIINIKKCGSVWLKPGTHLRQSQIRHGRLYPKSTKSTMSLWRRTQWQQSRKDVRHSGYIPATKLTHSTTKSTSSATKSTDMATMLSRPYGQQIGNEVDRISHRVDCHGDRRLSRRFVARIDFCRLSPRYLTLSPVCTDRALLMVTW